MNAIQQFYELVASRYYEIEQLKAEAKERGEIIFNITMALISGEIDEETYNDLIAITCEESESETR